MSLHSVQDHFARYPAHGLLATTHLMLREPEGDKYHFALKWGIPAVADRWVGTVGTGRGVVATCNLIDSQS